MGLISKSQAFITGHNLSYCAVYFDQVLLAARLANSSEQAKEHADKMIASLQRVGANFAARLQTVEATAKAANLTARNLPALPPEFYQWAQLRHTELLQFWPATDVGGCLFVIGHALGELRNGLIIANLTMDFTRNLQMDFSAQQQSVPLRLQEALIRYERALQIIENLPTKLPTVQLLRPMYDGIQVQISTSLALMKLGATRSDKAFTLNHKLLQILGNAEQEIQQHLAQY